MKLSDLLRFDRIVIQCHDNPDADAIGSGFALYSYFADKGQDVRSSGEPPRMMIIDRPMASSRPPMMGTSRPSPT